MKIYANLPIVEQSKLVVDLVIVCLKLVIFCPWNDVYVQMRDHLACLLSLVDADGASVSHLIRLHHSCKHLRCQANFKQL